MTFDRKHVYLVESAEDPTVLLALGPELLGGGALRWIDTLRERVKPGKVIRKDKDALVFKGEEGPTYTFRVLTLKAYDEKVRAKVEGQPSFKTEGEMHRFYVSRFLGAAPAKPAQSSK